MDWWNTLTEPQATVIAGILTLASGILVAIVAPLIVGSKFSDVKQAADQARELMRGADRVGAPNSHILIITMK
jgi:hypothetical protein